MSTTNDPSRFELPINRPTSYSPPDTRFQDAVHKAEQMSVKEFDRLLHWYELLPPPEFTPVEIPAYAYMLKLEKPTIHEQRLSWETKARVFFDKYRERVDRDRATATYHFTEILKVWSSRRRVIDKQPDVVTDEWMMSLDLSLVDYCKLYVNRKLLLPFLEEVAVKWEIEWGLSGMLNRKQAAETEDGKTTPTYRNFADLFISPDDIGPCVELLHEYPKAKGKNGFKKFVVLAWIDWLDTAKKLHSATYEHVSLVLTNELDGFTVARRTYYDIATGGVDAKEYFTVNFPQKMHNRTRAGLAGF